MVIHLLLRQARVAQKAGAKSLCFIHYSPDLYGSQDMIEEAEKEFLWRDQIC